MSANNNDTARELAMLYLQKQDLSDITPEQLGARGSPFSTIR